jgi:hypothetical protein
VGKFGERRHITALTGLAYARHTPEGAHLDVVLDKLIPHMADHIEQRNSRLWVANPRFAQENYADRFHGHQERHRALLDWLAAAERDFRLDTGGLDRAAASLDRSFGAGFGSAVTKQLGATVQQHRTNGRLGSTAAGAVALDTANPAPRHTFFGR